MGNDPSRPPSFRERDQPDLPHGIGGIGNDRPTTPGEAVRRVEPAVDTDGGDTDPDTVRACLDCETAWVGRGKWAYCPRCGTELELFEHAEVADD